MLEPEVKGKISNIDPEFFFLHKKWYFVHHGFYLWFYIIKRDVLLQYSDNWINFASHILPSPPPVLGCDNRMLLLAGIS